MNQIKRQFFWYSVACAGDRNADGFDDIIIGANDFLPMMMNKKAKHLFIMVPRQELQICRTPLLRAINRIRILVLPFPE
ncbi:MAG: FG-GAP repeat protein [Bacteroidetes bacterium]|nr:FG-GAP repeat protein [Bacteroidota bacterium]